MQRFPVDLADVVAWKLTNERPPIGNLVGGEALGYEGEVRGLIVAPGTEWFPAEASGPFIRLNYTGENPDRFPDAARILSAAIDAGP